MWWLACFTRSTRPPGFNIWVAYCAPLAGASLCFYIAPGLRWFLETTVVWMCGMRGLETSPPLTLFKGRALAVLGDSEA